ncbi:hypothetical protein G6F31_019974 [Rhizopus arrhizus]|nr:hypothetical protein G6F31_019974 [Rhizopus arrhizus]
MSSSRSCFGQTWENASVSSRNKGVAMWNLDFTPPVVIEAHVIAILPEGLRRKQRSAWADVIKKANIKLE